MRWPFKRRTRPYSGPLVLELEPIYPSGANGAVLARIDLADELEASERLVMVPAGANGIRLRLAHRAGIYAGSTVDVAVESEPPPSWLGSPRQSPRGRRA